MDYEELPVVTDAETALDPATPLIHPELGDNLAFERELVVGDVDAVFAGAPLTTKLGVPPKAPPTL